MLRYFFVLLIMGLMGIAIVVKACFIMFAERRYWQDIADRFVKENVQVPATRGNIISADGKLIAGSLPEYRIY
ncbi:Penicillin-binding protein 2, partial [termite gut metagenome]